MKEKEIVPKIEKADYNNKKNLANGNNEFNQINNDLKRKDNTSSSEIKNLSLKETTYKSINSDIISLNESPFSPNQFNPQNKNKVSSQNDLPEIKETNEIINLKESIENEDFLNNRQTVETIIFRGDCKEENEEEDPKINQEKFECNIPAKDNIFQNNNNYNKMPLFFMNNEIQKFKLNIEQNTNFQNNLTKKYILSCFADKNQTQILQSMIKGSLSKENIEAIVNELSGTYSTIIKNKNGNYFCCDLFSHCEERLRKKILKELSGTLSSDCNDKYGTHPIQVLVEYSSSEEEYDLILFSFNQYNEALLACLSPHGSYVTSKIISHIPEKFRMKFNYLFVSFLCFVVTKKYGVVNAKKFIDYTKNEEIINHVVNLTQANFLNIATNQFGNFFIQHLLEKWCNTQEGSVIKEEIIKNFRVLFQNKYSSFICDLFLKLSNHNDKKLLMNTLNLNLNNNNSKVDKLIMIKIMKSFGQKIGEKNVNNNNNRNHQITQSRFNLNNFNNNNFQNNNNPQVFLNQNQIPLSLNNFNVNNSNFNNNYNNNNYINNQFINSNDAYYSDLKGNNKNDKNDN